jgi:hypothetical protein
MGNSDHGRNRASKVMGLKLVGRSAYSTRRELFHHGSKLVFAAPLITTFFAREARAAASHQSCYPVGHACPGAEPCCSAMCAGSMTCSN